MRTLSKKRWKWMLVPALAAVLILALAGLALAAGPRSGQQAQSANQAGTITSTAPVSGTLTEDQKNEILYLLEEEKLAGDVYEYLDGVWKARVFSNIAASEDRHVEAVLTLMSAYEIAVPDTLGAFGEFQDPSLQTLYDQLIAQGAQSRADAYAVGVLIEETDIDDLEALLAGELPADVKQVLSNLLNGSKNHLKAFQRQSAR